jgi:hypothetical protein
MKRLVRRTASSAAERGDLVAAAFKGRLIRDRQTRDTKKTTKAAAVHGAPSCHPNTITTAAPNANSVSQNIRSPPPPTAAGGNR